MPRVSPYPPSATPSRAVGSALLHAGWLLPWAPSCGPVYFGHGSRVGLLDT